MGRHRRNKRHHIASLALRSMRHESPPASAAKAAQEMAREPGRMDEARADERCDV